MFRFEDSYFLLLLIIVIPLMIYYYLNKYHNMRIKFSTLTDIKASISSHAQFGQHFLFFLRLVAVALIIVALARPQIHNEVKEVISSGIDIMLVLDTSGSMEARDYSANRKNMDRLSVVKEVVKDFIDKRPGDRIGMVVFGTNAFTQCPVTLDHNILINFLRDVRIGMVGESTAIGSAIGIAVKRLKDVQGKSKIIILLTDGRSNAGQIAPLTAAELAKTFDIKIYTIGVGSKGSQTLTMAQQLKGYSRAQATLDDETLEKIANITGGLYFKATDTEGLKKIYQTIDKMEKTEVKVKQYGINTELFMPFLGIAILLFMAEILLANTLLTKIP
jgi:Ca-activated chloride channel family protein